MPAPRIGRSQAKRRRSNLNSGGGGWTAVLLLKRGLLVMSVGGILLWLGVSMREAFITGDHIYSMDLKMLAYVNTDSKSSTMASSMSRTTTATTTISPQSSAHATVMGMATSFPVVSYKRFVGSLRSVGYQGNIILIVDKKQDMQPGVYQYLKDNLSLIHI